MVTIVSYNDAIITLVKKMMFASMATRYYSTTTKMMNWQGKHLRGEKD